MTLCTLVNHTMTSHIAWEGNSRIKSGMMLLLSFLDLFQIKHRGGQLPNEVVLCIQQIAKCTFEESSQKKTGEFFPNGRLDWLLCVTDTLSVFVWITKNICLNCKMYLSKLLKLDAGWISCSLRVTNAPPSPSWAVRTGTATRGHYAIGVFCD